MPLRLAGPLALVCLSFAGCIVPQDAQPSVELGAVFATKLVHRGMTLVDAPVVIPELAVGLPTTTGGQLGFAVESSIELQNNNGAAWFPDGHAGRATQIEMIADYAHRFGDLDVRAGLHSYNLPNGLEFPNGERGGTSEVFVTMSMDVLEATPYVSAHYDFDEVHSSYLRGGLSEGFDLGKNFSLRLDGSIGYAASGQSSWMYGLDESGFADLRGEAVLGYRYDERTMLELGAHGSTMVDDTLDAWFNDLGIDDDVLWMSIGVSWSF